VVVVCWLVGVLIVISGVVLVGVLDGVLVDVLGLGKNSVSGAMWWIGCNSVSGGLD
jgi:hypothetical protein